MAHLFLSATYKSSGKTTVTMGLCRALADRGMTVQPFKKGPDYIDPMWLSAAAGRSSFNLDQYTMSESEIVSGFAHRLAGADIGLIEGSKGLHDGLDLEGSNSSAALAALLGSPVVLIIDPRGMTRGVAPLILGFQAFDRRVGIAGVILNRVGGERHEAKLRAAIERFTDVPVLGVIRRDPGLEIAERHLGLTPSNEAADAEARIAAISRAVAAQVDIDRMLDIAAGATPPRALTKAPARPAAGPGDVRIGIARDRAFGFYYADDLEALEAAGATLVPIDTIHDRDLPDIGGLLIGGGFPETNLEALAANTSLLGAIRHAIGQGLPVYAECGGLMYLARGITWGNARHRMAGVIDAEVVVHRRPVGKGYVRLRETGHCPWPDGGDDAPASEFPAHEFHYSSLEGLAGEQLFAYEMVRGHGIDGSHDGIVQGNLVAGFAHQRGVGGNRWPRRFVDFVRARGRR